MNMHNTNIATGNARVGMQTGHNPIDPPATELIGGQYTWGIGVAGGWYFGRITDRDDNGMVTIHATHRFTPDGGTIPVNARGLLLMPGTLRDKVSDLLH